MPHEQSGDVTPNTDEVKETLENQEDPTGEDVVIDPQDDDGDAEQKNKGDSFYEEQLKALEDENKRLKEEAEERQKQLEIKNRAIKALKRDKPESPKSDDRDSLKQEVLHEVKTEIRREKAQEFISTIAKDKTERDLFLHHYEKSVDKSDDVKNDVLRAIANANAPRILELLGRDRAEEDQEDRSISTMRGEGVRSPTARVKTALEKAAEEMIPKEARKYLKSNLTR